MSLILEALRKLERERDAPGRGLLVVAHTPWAAARVRAARLALLAIAAGALAGGSGWIVWNALSSRAAVAPSAPAASATSPRPGAAALAPPIWEATPAPARAVASAPPAVAPSAAPTPAGAPPAATPEPAAADPALLVIAPAAAPEQAPLRLEAISSQDGEPVAVINGRLVRKGESVEGALVTWIGADAVEVEVGGRRRVLGF